MKMEFDDLSRSVIGCTIEVHPNLGPGLLESTHRQCLAHELSQAGISFQMELPLPVRYKGILLDCGYRIDLHAQTLTYMRLAKVPVGLLINFNVIKLQSGIKRFVLS